MKTSKRIFVVLSTILILETSAHDSTQPNIGVTFANNNQNDVLQYTRNIGVASNQKQDAIHNRAIQKFRTNSQPNFSLLSNNQRNSEQQSLLNRNPYQGNNGFNTYKFRNEQLFNLQTPLTLDNNFQSMPAQYGSQQLNQRIKTFSVPLNLGSKDVKEIRLPIPPNLKFKPLHLDPGKENILEVFKNVEKAEADIEEALELSKNTKGAEEIGSLLLLADTELSHILEHAPDVGSTGQPTPYYPGLSPVPSYLANQSYKNPSSALSSTQNAASASSSASVNTINDNQGGFGAPTNGYNSGVSVASSSLLPSAPSTVSSSALSSTTSQGGLSTLNYGYNPGALSSSGIINQGGLGSPIYEYGDTGAAATASSFKSSNSVNQGGSIAPYYGYNLGATEVSPGSNQGELGGPYSEYKRNNTGASSNAISSTSSSSFNSTSTVNQDGGSVPNYGYNLGANGASPGFNQGGLGGPYSGYNPSNTETSSNALFSASSSSSDSASTVNQNRGSVPNYRYNLRATRVSSGFNQGGLGDLNYGYKPAYTGASSNALSSVSSSSSNLASTEYQDRGSVPNYGYNLGAIGASPGFNQGGLGGPYSGYKPSNTGASSNALFSASTSSSNSAGTVNQDGGSVPNYGYNLGTTGVLSGFNQGRLGGPNYGYKHGASSTYSSSTASQIKSSVPNNGRTEATGSSFTASGTLNQVRSRGLNFEHLPGYTRPSSSSDSSTTTVSQGAFVAPNFNGISNWNNPATNQAPNNKPFNSQLLPGGSNTLLPSSDNNGSGDPKSIHQPVLTGNNDSNKQTSASSTTKANRASTYIPNKYGQPPLNLDQPSYYLNQLQIYGKPINSASTISAGSNQAVLNGQVNKNLDGNAAHAISSATSQSETSNLYNIPSNNGNHPSYISPSYTGIYNLGLQPYTYSGENNYGDQRAYGNAGIVPDYDASKPTSSDADSTSNSSSSDGVGNELPTDNHEVSSKYPENGTSNKDGLDQNTNSKATAESGVAPQSQDDKSPKDANNKLSLHPTDNSQEVTSNSEPTTASPIPSSDISNYNPYSYGYPENSYGPYPQQVYDGNSPAISPGNYPYYDNQEVPTQYPEDGTSDGVGLEENPDSESNSSAFSHSQDGTRSYDANNEQSPYPSDNLQGVASNSETFTATPALFSVLSNNNPYVYGYPGSYYGSYPQEVYDGNYPALLPDNYPNNDNQNKNGDNSSSLPYNGNVSLNSNEDGVSEDIEDKNAQIQASPDSTNDDAKDQQGYGSQDGNTEFKESTVEAHAQIQASPDSTNDDAKDQQGYGSQDGNKELKESTVEAQISGASQKGPNKKHIHHTHRHRLWYKRRNPTHNPLLWKENNGEPNYVQSTESSTYDSGVADDGSDSNGSDDNYVNTTPSSTSNNNYPTQSSVPDSINKTHESNNIGQADSFPDTNNETETNAQAIAVSETQTTSSAKKPRYYHKRSRYPQHKRHRWYKNRQTQNNQHTTESSNDQYNTGPAYNSQTLSPDDDQYYSTLSTTTYTTTSSPDSSENSAPSGTSIDVGPYSSYPYHGGDQSAYLYNIQNYNGQRPYGQQQHHYDTSSSTVDNQQKGSSTKAESSNTAGKYFATGNYIPSDLLLPNYGSYNDYDQSINQQYPYTQGSSDDQNTYTNVQQQYYPVRAFSDPSGSSGNFESSATSGSSAKSESTAISGFSTKSESTVSTRSSAKSDSTVALGSSVTSKSSAKSKSFATTGSSATTGSFTATASSTPVSTVSKSDTPSSRAVASVLKILDSIEKLLSGKCSGNN